MLDAAGRWRYYGVHRQSQTLQNVPARLQPHALEWRTWTRRLPWTRPMVCVTVHISIEFYRKAQRPIHRFMKEEAYIQLFFIVRL